MSPENSELGSVDTDTHWITWVVSRVAETTGAPPLLASVLSFGLFPSTLVMVYVLLRDPALGFTLGCISVVIFLTATPYLVWRYDEVLYPTFFGEVNRVVERTDELDIVSHRYRQFFTDRYPYFAVPTTLLGVPMMVAARPFLRTQSVGGVTDPFYWVLFAVVLWLGVLIGVGVTGIVTTTVVIREITSERIVIDPFHPDQRGGLGAVGMFSVRTTVMFAMGSFLLPVQLYYVSTVGTSELTLLLYLLICLYTAAILLSFLYPVARVTREAEREREKELDRIRQEYNRVRRESRNEDRDRPSPDTATELKLQNLRMEYRDYQQMTLYPARIGVLSRLAGSVVLPLLFVFLDNLLNRDVVRDLLTSLF